MYEFLEETVERNMTSPAKVVAPEMTAGDLLRLFATDDLDAYPVVSNGKLVVDHNNRLKGMIAREDVIRALAFCDRRQALPLVAPAVGYYAIA